MDHSFRTQLHKRIVMLAVFSTVALAGSLNVWAQTQARTKIAYEVPTEDAKYTQQHGIEVADLPGHVVGLFELHRTFPKDPPTFAGLRVKEQWVRGTSDTVSGNGNVTAYAVYVLENGDKVFGTYVGASQATTGQSPFKRTIVGNTVLTGGTGKMRGIRGSIHVLTDTDVSKGLNDTKYEGEYWMEKE